MNPVDLTAYWLVVLAMALGGQLLLAKLDGLWRFRRAIAGVLTALYMVSFPMLWATQLQSFARTLIALAMLFVIVNSMRLWMNRFHSDYLRHSVTSNAWQLGGIIALLVVCSFVSKWLPHAASRLVIEFLMGITTALALYVLGRIVWALRHYKLQPIKPVSALRELPTVTLAIPARNETHALREMLDLAIKSDYPKLEILVLDDCSQDATAEVIRSYAHDGVRFVQGEVPSSGWLGKNYACEILAQEASGDLIIFVGVDTHFAAQSISQIVSYMLREKLGMLSILPQRRFFDAIPTFFEQLRNFWQIALPSGRRHVPISSPCWAIQASELRRLGGFRAFRSSVFPEVHFARQLRAASRYAFVIASDQLEVTTRKRLSSQLATATRTFYPMLKRKPVMVLLVVSALSLMLLPYGVVVWALFRHDVCLLAILALLPVAAFTVGHMLLLRRTAPRGWLVGLINFPILVALDALLFCWSMLQFEFGEVNWKGRNVCYPIIEAIPKEQFSTMVQAESVPKKPQSPHRVP